LRKLELHKHVEHKGLRTTPHFAGNLLMGTLLYFKWHSSRYRWQINNSSGRWINAISGAWSPKDLHALLGAFACSYCWRCADLEKDAAGALFCTRGRPKRRDTEDSVT